MCLTPQSITTPSTPLPFVSIHIHPFFLDKFHPEQVTITEVDSGMTTLSIFLCLSRLT
jgi:hypothetical protein